MPLLLFAGFIWLVVDLSVHHERWGKRFAPLVAFGRLLAADAKAIGGDILKVFRVRRAGKAEAPDFIPEDWLD